MLIATFSDPPLAPVPAKESMPNRERIQRARASLPASPRGGRMHGVYLSQSGEDVPLRSGDRTEDGQRDKDWRLAATFLADLDPGQFTAQNPPWFAHHVEAKFAMRMWRERLTDATIVIEEQPCGSDAAPDDPAARLTCDRWLGRMVPPGARLNVITRSGQTYTYHGPRRQS